MKSYISILIAITFFAIPLMGQTTTEPTRYDFDGDGKADPSIFRKSVGEWWNLKSSNNGHEAVQFGMDGDFPVAADFTGDGITDRAFYRRSSGEWFILRSEDDGFHSFPFGSSGDIAMADDVDGDGKADPTVYRVGNGTWYSLLSGSGDVKTQKFGVSSDSPKLADYDGDGRADFAIYRPETKEWWIDQTRDGLVVYTFGPEVEDLHSLWPVDLTGDGAAELVYVYLPQHAANLEWFVSPSENRSTYYSFPFGVPGDLPALADYDGDTKVDLAVFRRSSRLWYINNSTEGMQILGFGLFDDRPTPLYPATF